MIEYLMVSALIIGGTFFFFFIFISYLPRKFPKLTKKFHDFYFGVDGWRKW